MVDMVTTRNNDFGQILVVVWDPNLLPSSMDVVIDDHYFQLKVEKEKVGFHGNGDVVELISEIVKIMGKGRRKVKVRLIGILRKLIHLVLWRQ